MEEKSIKINAENITTPQNIICLTGEKSKRNKICNQMIEESLTKGFKIFVFNDLLNELNTDTENKIISKTLQQTTKLMKACCKKIHHPRIIFINLSSRLKASKKNDVITTKLNALLSQTSKFQEDTKKIIKNSNTILVFLEDYINPSGMFDIFNKNICDKIIKV